MKNFIITAGTLFLILTIMQYQFTLNQLLRDKADLKNVADEAAAAAALCVDAESFGEGALCFNRETAASKAGASISANLKERMMKDLQWEITFNGEELQRPEVSVVLQWKKLKVISVYEYVPYK